MDFSKMSNEELKENIKNINEESIKRKYGQKPEIKEIYEVNLEPLMKICKEYTDYCDGEDYCDDNDYREYIFETAMQAFYGEEFWEWLNKRY